MDDFKFLGTIYSVNSNNISLLLDDKFNPIQTVDDRLDVVGQLGSYVVIQKGEQSIIGTVSSIISHDLSSSDTLSLGKRTMDVQLLGSVHSGIFERGISSYPMIGDRVYVADQNDLKAIFSMFRQNNFSVGKLSLFEKERLYLDPNKFFAKHVAIFGSTGSGKSCTMASIIQKVDKYDNTHVVLLDLHGEYEPAFKNTGNVIKITELELPYWLMNFDELVETFIDESEPSAHNQMMIMKDAILDSKRGKNMTLKDFLTIDTPVYFDFLDVRGRMQSLDTERTLAGKEGPFYGQFTRFLVRLNSKLEDKRYEFLFKPKNYRSSDTLSALLTKLFALDSGKRITVIDLSRVPFDVINVLVSLLGRIIYDFNLWNSSRRDFPILIVFEEAHTYLSMTGKSSAARKTVERIAKEGRKYGVSCMIVSQRPSEISETITAQCNNFVALRLLNPNDQSYIRKLVPDTLSNLIDILPTLRQGEAFFLGDAVATPTRVMIDAPSPAPASGDIKFFEKWVRKESDTVVGDVVNNWWKQIRT